MNVIGFICFTFNIEQNVFGDKFQQGDKELCDTSINVLLFQRI